MNTPSAIHLTSLLDLATPNGSVSATQVLNTALLTLMGRLRISRGCVLQKQGDSYVAHATLCKGMEAFAVDMPEVQTVSVVDCTEGWMKPLADRNLTTLVPCRSSGWTVAVIALGAMYQGHDTDEGMRDYLELAGMIAGTAAANASMITEMQSARKELEARNLLVTSLFESARDFTTSKTNDELLRVLAYRLMGQLMVSTFAVYLSRPCDGETVIVPRPQALKLQDLYPDILVVSQPMLVASIDESNPLRARLELAGIAAVAPMTLHGTPQGVIAVCPKLSGIAFTANELQFIEAIGNSAIAAIENNRLVAEELEKQRIESELSIAKTIQQQLLPIDLPVLSGIDVAARSDSSRQIGGDYYDVIKLDANRTMMVVADVAGKGIPAALLMANVQATITALAPIELTLDELMKRVNTVIYQNTQPEVFVTAFVVVIDVAKQTLEYVNAGHNPPILVRGSDVEMLTEGGIILGIMSDPPRYTVGTVSVSTSNVLVLYTDGVTETRRDLEEFGVERLTEIVTSNAGATVGEILDAIRLAISEFSSTETLIDDTSVVVAKIL